MIFPYPWAETVLPNGLLVVAIPLDTPGLAGHYVAVRTGSRNETEPGRSGFAHFFEHMMFRGTPRYPPERYNDVLKRLGADGNAFTTDDWTCYHVVAASSALDVVMDLESDRFMNLEYGVEAFQKEAAAVLGEYNKNASIPFNALFEKLHDTAYTTHTYKHTTMGFLKDIEDMPNQFEHSLSFFERWYRADNARPRGGGRRRPGEGVRSRTPVLRRVAAGNRSVHDAGRAQAGGGAIGAHRVARADPPAARDRVPQPGVRPRLA